VVAGDNDLKIGEVKRWLEYLPEGIAWVPGWIGVNKAGRYYSDPWGEQVRPGRNRFKRPQWVRFDRMDGPGVMPLGIQVPVKVEVASIVEVHRWASVFAPTLYDAVRCTHFRVAKRAWLRLGLPPTKRLLSTDEYVRLWCKCGRCLDDAKLRADLLVSWEYWEELRTWGCIPSLGLWNGNVPVPGTRPEDSEP